VAIAPVHETGNEYRLDGTSFFDWGMVYPSDQRREHNTLCHRIIALWSGGDSCGPYHLTQRLSIQYYTRICLRASRVNYGHHKEAPVRFAASCSNDCGRLGMS